jgi:hypothetical protein
LKGKEVDLTIEGIVKVFKLLSTRIITRGKEGYNTTTTKCGCSSIVPIH